MKALAILAGIVFIVLGACGFVPSLSPDGRLFGAFAIDDTYKYLLIGGGVVLLALGLFTHREEPPPPGPRRDLRDLTWQ
jgi:hypothetical protein